MPFLPQPYPFIWAWDRSQGTQECASDGWVLMQYLQVQKNRMLALTTYNVGCDGTNVVTGKMAGVIRRLKESFNYLLQWMVCLLHANELSLRHLFEAVDGATSSLRGFSDFIGKRLLTCSKQPVSLLNNDTMIKQLSNLDSKKLNTD